MKPSDFDYQILATFSMVCPCSGCSCLVDLISLCFCDSDSDVCVTVVHWQGAAFRAPLEEANIRPKMHVHPMTEYRSVHELLQQIKVVQLVVILHDGSLSRRCVDPCDKVFHVSCDEHCGIGYG